MIGLHSWFVAIGALLVGATAAWSLSVRLRNASIIDPLWGPAFVLVVWIYAVAGPGGITARGWVVALLVTLWGLRLGLHLGLRAIGKAEDSRYAAMRERNGPNWWWTSLFWVFWLQAGLVAVISLPLVEAARSRASLGAMDLVAGIVFIVGFLFEVVGDAQLTRFRADPTMRGKVLETGLWQYTRHPNYFGDALLWWGLWLFAIPGGGAWTVFAPILMTTLLMRVSGVPLLEARLKETRPGYAEYLARTPAFFPWFPRKQR